MRWLISKGLWKAVFVLAGTLLVVVLLTGIHVSSAEAHEPSQGVGVYSVAGGTMIVQPTPTEDATVTALNKEKLVQDVDQQRHTWGNWLWNNGEALISSLVLAIVGAFILFRYLRDQRSEREKKREDQQAERERRDEAQQRWLKDQRAERERRDEEQQRWLKNQRAEREKRAEERFQAVVEGLGREREEARVGAAITLPTFLRSEFEQFYQPTFDLAVAHLRLPRSSQPSEDQEAPLPLTTLSQALVVVFKESFPLARDMIAKDKAHFGAIQVLDATGIRLDHAYLASADLQQAWMPHVFLRNANLSGANLSGADLSGADFRGTNLRRADLSGANFSMANLRRADLSMADLSGANFSMANLHGADLRVTRGLTREKREAYKAIGAFIDNTTATSPSHPIAISSADGTSPQSTPPTPESNGTSDANVSAPASLQAGVSPSLDAQSNGAPSQSPPPAQDGPAAPADDTERLHRK